MAAKLSMDEQWRVDIKLVHDLRQQAIQLELLADQPRMAGSTISQDARLLAEKLRAKADHIVQVWD